MLVRSLIISSLAAGSALLAGCADTSSMFGNGANLTTSSVAPTAAPKADPVCASLTSQIDSLRKDGVADKIEKASLKKYKMTTAELVKADQLNKANADFQTKCSTYKPTTAAAVTAPAAAAAVKEAANTVAAKP
jgi:predicted small secreted protein